MLTVYGIANCTTVKKAKDFLDEKGISYKFHNYKKEGISLEKLIEWDKQIGLEGILNKSSRIYKALEPDEKKRIENKDYAFKALQERPSMIKRPILENGEIVSLGYNLDDYEVLFN